MKRTMGWLLLAAALAAGMGAWLLRHYRLAWAFNAVAYGALLTYGIWFKPRREKWTKLEYAGFAVFLVVSVLAFWAWGK